VHRCSTPTCTRTASLTLGADSQDAVESILEGKVTKTIATTSGGVVRLSLKGGWAHEFDATRNVLDEAFAAGSSPFAMAGAETGRNAGLFGASMSFDLSKRVSFFGRYDGAYGDRATNHAVSVGFNMVW
jgi:outer membrane autotransporter protein